MRRIRLPKAEELFPVPVEQIAAADLRELEDNPVWKRLLSKLQQKAYRQRVSLLDKSDNEILKELRAAEGAASVLGDFEETLDSIREELKQRKED